MLDFLDSLSQSQMILLFVIIFIFFILLPLALLSIFPANMAIKRGRSYLGWFLFSMFTNPLIAMIFLYLIGDTEEIRLSKIKEKAEIFKQVFNFDIKKPDPEEKKIEDLSKYKGKSIHEMYRDIKK